MTGMKPSWDAYPMTGTLLSAYMLPVIEYFPMTGMYTGQEGMPVKGFSFLTWYPVKESLFNDWG